MAQLGGKSVRTVLTALEVLSDDGEHVLMLDPINTYSNDGVTLKVRRPWESAWGSGLPTFTLRPDDADIVAKIVTGQDASYIRTRLEAINTSDFRREDPNPKVDEDEAARCAELDIERARAANIQQEFVLDHSRDRHVGADVPGCPTCEAKVIPDLSAYNPPERNTITATGEGDEGELPF